MLPINEIICGRNESVLATFPAECIDLTVTSPPYDNLRSYKGFEWDFTATAQQLYRVTKIGGVVVWVVADATINGSETGTSFRQALAFMALGFNLHDTMIYQKSGVGAAGSNAAYSQCFEYMFVFSKGKINTFNPIRDRLNVTHDNTGKYRKVNSSRRRPNGSSALENITPTLAHGKRDNIWKYNPIEMRWEDNEDHPAVFPEKLAGDHILSWSNPGDLVLDPFVGSGTTPKMAIRHHRQYIGIDISAEYCELTRKRISCVQQLLFSMAS